MVASADVLGPVSSGKPEGPSKKASEAQRKIATEGVSKMRMSYGHLKQKIADAKWASEAKKRPREMRHC